MRNTFKTVSSGLRACAGFALAMAALGGSNLSAVQYSYQGETGGLVMGLHTVIPGYENGYSFAVGQFNMTTADPGWDATLLTYCTDVGTLLSFSHEYTPLTFTDPLAVGVNPIWVHGGIQKAAKVWYAYDSSSTSDIEKAGMQLAIWEALNNTQSSYSATDFFSSSNPSFYITSANAGAIGQAAAYAASLLNSIPTLPATPNGTWLAPVENGMIRGSQGLLYDPPFTVPDAASSAALLSAALGGMLLLGRRIREA